MLSPFRLNWNNFFNKLLNWKSWQETLSFIWTLLQFKQVSQSNAGAKPCKVFITFTSLVLSFIRKIRLQEFLIWLGDGPLFLSLWSVSSGLPPAPPLPLASTRSGTASSARSTDSPWSTASLSSLTRRRTQTIFILVTKEKMSEYIIIGLAYWHGDNNKHFEHIQQNLIFDQIDFILIVVIWFCPYIYLWTMQINCLNYSC